MVRIITDGTSDLSARRAEELNVHVMPMRVFFGQESFVAGVDIPTDGPLLDTIETIGGMIDEICAISDQL